MVEQHPVPQNVTTFQFRLIGDMTIKQFGYLAGGAVLGYVSYKLPLPFFFTWPMTAVFILGGIGFAFVPVEQRPMDIWFLSFIKSVYSPTLYIWQRDLPAKVIPISPQPSSTTQKNIWQAFFATKAKLVSSPVQKTAPVQDSLPTVLASAPIPTVKTPESPQTDVPTPIQTTVPVLTQTSTPSPQMQEEKKEDQTQTTEQKLQQALEDKKKLEEELASIKQMLMAQQNTPAAIQQAGEKSTYIPSPQRSAPNVITGTVRQQTGELLHSILVTVKDKDDVPLRALKTNKMGQFASSTPLPLGTYTIDVEDPKGMFFFQPITIVLDGKIIEPVTVVAKTKQDLDRQKLADALFGKRD